MNAMTIDSLRARHCVPRKGKADAIGTDEIAALLALLPPWQEGLTTYLAQRGVHA